MKIWVCILRVKIFKKYNNLMNNSFFNFNELKQKQIYNEKNNPIFDVVHVIFHNSESTNPRFNNG